MLQTRQGLALEKLILPTPNHFLSPPAFKNLWVVVCVGLDLTSLGHQERDLGSIQGVKSLIEILKNIGETT